MPDIRVCISKLFQWLSVTLFCIFLFTSCLRPIVKNAPVDKPYLFENKIEVKGGNFTKTQKSDIKQRLFGQLDDSSVIKTKDKYIVLHYIIAPPAYDSGYTGISARNMEGSMLHLGYYNARVSFEADTSRKKRVTVTYKVDAGPPTLIDTVRYILRKDDLQEIADRSIPETKLRENEPVTKNGVLTEIARLVDTFRNNGYYKFTAAELIVRGDTTIEALTSVSDDPFEQLRLLAEAEQKRDSPEIKLAVVLNPPADASKLQRFYINNIYVLPDFRQGDTYLDTTAFTRFVSKNFITQYHERLFRISFLNRVITLRPGTLFKQNDYFNTLRNLTKIGVWQSINIQLVEVPSDTLNKIDVIVELVTNRKLQFQAALETSYSASSSTSNFVAGNLFGLSGNLSLLNRNVGKEAIRMTHNVRAGVELNNNSSSTQNQLVNSTEIGYTNVINIPRLIFPKIVNVFSKNKTQTDGETFISTAVAYSNRLNLYSLQSVNFNFGWNRVTRGGWNVSIRPFTTGFSNVVKSDSFNTILREFPFLRYSYNTAFMVGAGIGISKTYSNPIHKNSLSRERLLRFNFEESGLTWGLIPVLNKYKRRYIRLDSEYKYIVNYRKTAIALRFFAGVGIPLLGSDTNRTLPLVKQYFGGGSNSMRGWPIRGIGIGGNPIAPYNTNRINFNDRTGDLQLEYNLEYRYDIARIIPNTLTLRGALFVDAGNVWNILNTKPDGGLDSARFDFKNLYSQLGVSAGTGLRLDFNYLILRFDFGFRFKRPDLYYNNNGWKIPDISFNDALKKIFTRGPDDEFRKWRYENFNFTVGIGYSF